MEILGLLFYGGRVVMLRYDFLLMISETKVVSHGGQHILSVSAIIRQRLLASTFGLWDDAFARGAFLLRLSRQ